MSRLSFQRLFSMATKEWLHILRDRQTLVFTLMVPILEMLMLGYANDTNVRHVRTAVLDQACTQESRALIKQFENSQMVKVIEYPETEGELTQAIVAGRVRVGIKIPHDYSRELEAGRSAEFLVLVDGSISSVASEAINVGNSLALRESLARVVGDKPLPVESRPRVLFNPDTRSANFFIPGLIVVLCQMMATMLTANALVREKEQGTLEQLFMTPVNRSELILGKLLPYLLFNLAEFAFLAVLMQFMFRVPIHGSFATLFLAMIPFVLIQLGTGLWISTRADTKEAASQMMMGTVLPSIFLSGYVFPTDSMPAVFQWISVTIPTTWMIDVSRGVILRGADWPELWQHALILWSMAVGTLSLAAWKLQKRL